MKKSLFTIRKRRKTRHPQIVVDADKTKFKSVTLTHSKLIGSHESINLPDNPNPNDETISYFAKRIISDFKFNYSKEFQNYKLSDKDIEIIIKFLKSKQK